jgi:ribosome-associated toxin RatA of RatAB toxin-antitoxin module
MSIIQTIKFVGYPWSDLFNLVLDVKSYPEFVPRCREVRLLSHLMTEPGVTIIVSRMTVGFSAFEVSYANWTTAGRFEPLDEDHTQLHFLVDYEFSNPLLAAVASCLHFTVSIVLQKHAAAGNVIEWYDFYIFGSLATILSVKFFEKSHPVARSQAALLELIRALVSLSDVGADPATWSVSESTPSRSMPTSWNPPS